MGNFSRYVPVNHNHEDNKVWQRYWKEADQEEAIKRIKDAMKASRWWQKIAYMAKNYFGRIKGLNIVEIGAGAGEMSAKMALSGASCTLCDYSPNAIEFSREIFSELHLEADFQVIDAFNLPEQLLKKFDVAMSFGLVEHFKKQRREKIISAHNLLLKPNGLAIINSPNAWCFPYRIEKFVRQLTHTWRFGEEFPFSPIGLKKIARKCNLEPLEVWGWSFYGSLEERLIKRMRFLFLNLWYNHSIRRCDRIYPVRRFLKVKPSVLDPYFGDTITLFARKI
ncbi:MAG: class I SAM-dependent methyltransferase [Candidatus Hodarchaeota archaeon]